MLILATDTTTDRLSIALSDGDRLIDSWSEVTPRQHAELLLGTTETLLERNNVSLDAIDLLTVSRGPGSFTGTRIGVSAWKGLAVGLDKPLVGISSLAALADTAPPEAEFLYPMIDARIGEVFTAVYRRVGDTLKEHAEEQAALPDEAICDIPDGTVILGDGAVRFSNEIQTAFPQCTILAENFLYPEAASVAKLAAHRWRANPQGNAGDVVPVYLRKIQAQQLRVPNKVNMT